MIFDKLDKFKIIHFSLSFSCEIKKKNQQEIEKITDHIQTNDIRRRTPHCKIYPLKMCKG